MARGYFTVTQNVDGNDIIVQPNGANTNEIPEEQQNLSIDIATVLATINLLYRYSRSQDRFKIAFTQLLGIAQMGLQGDANHDNAQPPLANKALKQLKKEIVEKENRSLKNKYIKKLGWRAIFLGTPTILIAIFCLIFTSPNENLKCFYNFLILWSGTMLGVWLSFIFTRTTISFEDISDIISNDLEPIFRLLYTGFISIVFGMLFLKKALDIKLGNLSAQDLSTDSITAFLIGSIMGLNEKVLGGILAKKTSEMLTKMT